MSHILPQSSSSGLNDTQVQIQQTLPNPNLGVLPAKQPDSCSTAAHFHSSFWGQCPEAGVVFSTFVLFGSIRV